MNSFNDISLWNFSHNNEYKILETPEIEENKDNDNNNYYYYNLY